MEGFFIHKSKGSTNRVNQYSSVTRLLASGDNVDIMLFEAIPGRPCSIIPGESPDLLEFFYALEGSAVIRLEEGDVTINAGDYFYAFHLKGNALIESESGIKLIYVSSKPMFKFLNSWHEELDELVRKTEEKDIYTHNHSLRVQTYSIKICEKLKQSKEIIHTLALSSLFHDIGKCIIPDDLLKKPGKLTSEEYELIKTHSAESAKLLRGKFEESICNIVEQHHERLDGSGYPKGLMGEEIAMEARIIAVADSYDAMTSDRAYRKAMSPAQALSELLDMSPRFYDKSVVRALEEVLVEEDVL